MRRHEFLCVLEKWEQEVLDKPIMGTRRSRFRASKACLVVLVLLSCSQALAQSIRYIEGGHLGPREEAIRWRINRARFAPEAEADRLGLINTTPGGSPDYDACEDISGPNNFGTGLEQWASWVASKGPLAPNAALTRAAQNHAQDMAETGKLQHNSPSSTYYPLNSWPWNRTDAEGYANQISGYLENLAYAGYGSTAAYPPQANTAEGVHQALFIDATAPDRGHRQAILNATAREIGVGFQRAYGTHGSFFMTYDYDAQNFGRRIGRHFFTDTLFHDTNGNGIYDPGEGVGNVEIRLFQNTTEAPFHDVSSNSGSFAIPLEMLAPGESVLVVLVNTASHPVTLSLPLGYWTLGEVDIEPGETYEFGTFTQPMQDTNVGIRQVEPITAVSIRHLNGEICLTFRALRGATYAIDAMEPGSSGDWATFATIVATQSDMLCTDSEQGTRSSSTWRPVRLYRVRLLPD